MTSTAALPFVLLSLSRGMYAISLQGSKREYFAPLLRMFCAAPISTANIKGVVPTAAVNGVNTPGNKMRLKKAAPVVRRVIGGIIAAVFQPNLSKIVRPPSIINSVTTPVQLEKFPMKAL